MKKLLTISLILLIATGFWSCQDSSTGSETEVEEAPQERQFIWNAMNYWYYWQAQVPKLSDGKDFFDNEQDFQNYLMDFNDTEAVFEDLLFNSDNNFANALLEQYGEDDFSFFIDNYEDFLEQRQGRSYNFGFEYGLVQLPESVELFGYVQYVLHGTPADNAGIERGDVFTHVNGTRLTVNNYRNALSTNNLELDLADYNDGNPEANGETVTVQAAEVTEDPIYLSKVIDAGTSKVGYLMYNSFQTNSHENLNNVFGEFASQGIDELVLDLRYNGGGAVITSQVLSSMISGLEDSDEFGEFSFNSKRAPTYNENLTFQSQVPLYDSEGNRTDQTIPLNSVSLNQLYVLTGFGTASASESVINSLKPYMDVIVIGRTTVGKDDVSITLYDTGTPYYNRPDENSTPAHKYAIQPIVAKIVNKDGNSNGEGFQPKFEILEYKYLDNLPPIGDENEPLLAKALEEITGEPVAKLAVESKDFRGEMFKDSRDLNKFEKNMYILPSEMKKIGLGPDHINK